MNLQSTINEFESCTQIIHSARANVKRTITGLLPSTIKEGSLVKMKRKDGSYVLINPDNVLFVECFEEDNKKI